MWGRQKVISEAKKYAEYYPIVLIMKEILIKKQDI